MTPWECKEILISYRSHPTPREKAEALEEYARQRVALALDQSNRAKEHLRGEITRLTTDLQWTRGQFNSMSEKRQSAVAERDEAREDLRVAVEAGMESARAADALSQRLRMVQNRNARQVEAIETLRWNTTKTREALTARLEEVERVSVQRAEDRDILYGTLQEVRAKHKVVVDSYEADRASGVAYVEGLEDQLKRLCTAIEVYANFCEDFAPASTIALHALIRECRV